MKLNRFPDDKRGAEMTGADGGISVWTPLKQPLFRNLWIAAIFSSIGSWMHNVAAAWLMVILTMSPLMVGLLNAAASLPYSHS